MNDNELNELRRIVRTKRNALRSKRDPVTWPPVCPLAAIMSAAGVDLGDVDLWDHWEDDDDDD